jgi:uncharacterized protein (TIGR00661 family)
MANILYGVNGEGAGHSTRAKEIISHLQQTGHSVHVVSFDRGLMNLRRDFEVTEIHGWRLAYVNNQVRYRRTIAKNLLGAGKMAASVAHLKKLSKQWKVDLVITDFEPLSCHVGHSQQIPVISIDNQHCLTHMDISCPRKYRADAAATRMVVRMMVPRADSYLVTSFTKAKSKRSNTFSFPPILRQSVLRAKQRTGEQVLVYVTSPAPAVANLLASIRCPFVAYGFGREGQDGNVLYKKPSLDGFLEDLINAKAIVANSGFSLITEALHLGKPYLAVPLEHQFEQIFNAYCLQKIGYGVSWEELNRERVESFLYNLPYYRENLSSYPRQGNEALLAKLDALIAEYASSSRAADAGR